MRRTFLAFLLPLLSWGLSAQAVLDVRCPSPSKGAVLQLLPVQVVALDGRLEVLDQVGRVQLSVRLRNPNGSAVTGQFVCALPAGLIADTCSLRAGAVRFEGRVVAADAGGALLRAAVRSGNGAALLALSGQQLFSATLPLLPAAADSVVELRFDQLLPRIGNQTSCALPFVAALAGVPLQFTAELRTSTALGVVYAPGGNATVERIGTNEAKVRWHLANTANPPRVYFTSGDGAPAVQLLGHREDAQGGSFALLVGVPAGISQAEPLAKDVVFVADTSGSMQGERLQQLMRALSHGIRSLRSGDRFSLVTFASSARVHHGLVAADAQHSQEALTAVAALHAEGGTNLCAGLAAGLETLVDARRPQFVVLFADGAPTVGVTSSANILQRVAAANTTGARLFAFGIGNELHVELLDLLAERSGGECSYVAAGENMAPALERFFGRIAEPVLTQLTVQAEGVTLSQMTPEKMPDIFRGSQVLLTGRWDGAPQARLSISATSAHGVVRTSEAVDFESGAQLTAIVPRLHATRRLGVLLDAMRLRGETPELLAEARALSQRFGLLTPWTAAWMTPAAPASAVPAGRAAWASTAMAASTHLQQMRTNTGESGAASDEVKNLGGRILLRRDSGWVQLSLALAPQSSWAARLERVEEESARWEELLREDIALAAVFALGPTVLVEHAGHVIQLVPATR